MTIWERVRTALDGLGVAVRNNRMIMPSGSAVPARYVTYQVITETPERHADNKEVIRSFLVQVNCWSQDGFERFPDVEAAMLSAGFYFSAARDMDYEEKSGHYGRSLDFVFVEDKQEG